MGVAGHPGGVHCLGGACQWGVVPMQDSAAIGSCDYQKNTRKVSSCFCFFVWMRSLRVVQSGANRSQGGLRAFQTGPQRGVLCLEGGNVAHRRRRTGRWL